MFIIPWAVTHEFEAFDILLDRLLNRKKELATASLFPTERMEVRPSDLFDSVMGNENKPDKKSPLTIEDLDVLNPYYFEAAVAALWKKSGADRVLLTPKSKDKGADVVVFGEGKNILLQVKQSNQIIGDTAVGEITKSKGYYDHYYQLNFTLGISDQPKIKSKCNCVGIT